MTVQTKKPSAKVIGRIGFGLVAFSIIITLSLTNWSDVNEKIDEKVTNFLTIETSVPATKAAESSGSNTERRILEPGAEPVRFYPRGRPSRWYCYDFHLFRIYTRDGNIWYGPGANKEGWIRSDEVDWDHFERIAPRAWEFQIGVPTTREIISRGRRVVVKNKPTEVVFVNLDNYHY